MGAAGAGHVEEGRVRDADPPFFVGSSRWLALSFIDHPLTRMIGQRAPRTRAYRKYTSRQSTIVAVE